MDARLLCGSPNGGLDFFWLLSEREIEERSETLNDDLDDVRERGGGEREC